MNQVVIKKCTVFDIENAPNIEALLDEYREECIIEGMPPLVPDWILYKKMEDAGIFQFMNATIDGYLIGLVTVISTIIPHYSQIISVAESFFVLSEYRKTGAGLKLRRAAENHAREMGATGLLISTPIGGVLAKVLEKDDNYKETNRVFFKQFI